MRVDRGKLSNKSGKKKKTKVCWDLNGFFLSIKGIIPTINTD